jgi:hypothetical protein
MTKHSSIVGGSTAGRLLNCPGSFQATLALPPSTDTPSEYAEEGSFGHEVMGYLMSGAAGPSVEMARSFVGMRFYDRVMTKAHLDEMILPALDAFEQLMAAYDIDVTDWPHETVAIEKSVAFPGIPGAFGTADVLLRVGDHVFLVDWKFGAGVPVKAVYRNEEGDLINPQLMFYATAARASARHLFRGAKVLVVAIVQPRTDEPLTHTTVTNRDIKWFREDLQNAVLEATSRDPRLTKGEWCRWAPCKVSCPLWTGPMLDLVGLELVPRTEMVAKEVTPYAQYLARAKALVDMLALYSKEVNDQLHAYLEDGGTVPGWKLKRKVKQRQWVDEETVDLELRRLGFKADEIWDSKLVTFAKADAAAKAHGVKIPDHLRVAPASNETTVTTSDDPAPAVERHTAIEQFTAALEDLRKQA